MRRIPVGTRWLGEDDPTYFIADISANHDGDLERARALIRLAAEAGADAAKFQNFQAPKIVSEQGFKRMGAQSSHQASWKKSVYQVYQEASLPWEWTEILKAECEAVGIDYFSTPYDFEAVDMLDPFVPVFKIGSGDITWPEFLAYVAKKGKPMLLATALGVILIVFCLPRKAIARWQRPAVLLDAIGLGAFAIQAALMAKGLGFSLPAVVVSALLTGAGGGIIRDLLAHRKPMVFQHQHPLYGVWAMAAALAIGLGWPDDPFSLFGLLVMIVVLRMASVVWDWKLPRRSIDLDS